ncbi:hypothetical protein CRG98_047445 [Punica granatum]|uniref:Serine-threonine/tyrosine-protein kinase catalytic domain-containing protein n=1 Tax=Punica granatum TaxID=22663 RepID=A0A2I0HK69_PUNGR|nr:hypothetical protein CRG98_047445 [Punica granatum]
MGICWGAPHFPAPSFTGYLRPGHKSLVYSGTSSSYDEETRSLGGISVESVPNGEIVPTPDVRVFTLAELQKSLETLGPIRSSEEEALAESSKATSVGRGPPMAEAGYQLPSKNVTRKSVRGFREWMSEVTFLGRLSHPNIVRLLGYCSEEENRLLIYEYMPKGTLKITCFEVLGTYGYAAPEYIAAACLPLSPDGAREPAFHGRSLKET